MRAVWPKADCRARARLTATVVAPLPPLALTMEKYLAAGTFFVNPALSRSEANKGFEQVGGSGGTLDKFAGAGAHGADDDLSWLRLPMARRRVGQFLARSSIGAHGHGMVVGGISMRRTSGLAACTRRMTGRRRQREGAQVWTVLATLVPSTSTWSTVRCSLSVATMTTAEFGHKRVLLLN